MVIIVVVGLIVIVVSMISIIAIVGLIRHWRGGLCQCHKHPVARPEVGRRVVGGIGVMCVRALPALQGWTVGRHHEKRE